MADLSFASFDDLPGPVATTGSHAASDASCPQCDAASLQRSRVRWYERWRKVATTRRPFRCAACGHRMWMPPPAPNHHVDVGVGAPADEADLCALDIDWNHAHSV